MFKRLGVLMIIASSVALLVILVHSVPAGAQNDAGIELPAGGSASVFCADGMLPAVQNIGVAGWLLTCADVAPEPTATSTPAGSVEPYADAPLCAEHDNTSFHLLWDEQNGCHYDHEHGAPYPDWAVQLFSDYTLYTDQEIGYAWQTPNENELKHAGYNFGGADYRANGCAPAVTAGGVNAWWFEAHGMANEMGQLARVHSFWGAAHLCHADGSSAGVIISGGHADFGQLHSPYKVAIVSSDVYERAPEVYNMHQPPYVGTARDARTFETWNSISTRQSAPYVDEHQLMQFAFRIGDPVGAVQLDGSFDEFGGNSSARHFYEVHITIPESLARADGLVNYTGYTDVHGNIDTSCTAASANCVPLRIINAVPGRYSVNANQAGWLGLRDYYEGDVYFDGLPSGWIGGMN